MIDTIVLALTRDMFVIKEPGKFTPSAHWIMEAKFRDGISQSKQNPTTKELKKGIYRPRLTLFNSVNKRGVIETILKIEFSLPKLIFGNNFNELRYKDFLLLLQKLVEVLSTMGVIVTPEALSQASVFAIHYSKNIKLTDGSTPYHFIQKIKEANIKLSLDVNQTDYRNEGHSYKWHCNSYEVVFYDKIRDLEKAKQSAKRAMEKDSGLQINLLKKLQKRRKLEFLRMEIRLNKRQKIKQLFSALGISAELTFKKLFKPAISKKVLLHYLDEIEQKRLPLIDYKAPNDKALLADLIFNNPTLGPKQILQIFGLKKALETMNMRELKVVFGKQNSRSISRLITEASKAQLPFGGQPFQIIRKQLEEFKAVRIPF